MAGCFADNLLTARRLPHNASKIAHAAGRNEEACFLSESFSSPRLQAIDGRVFQVNIVTDFGVRHSLAHGRCWLCDCIAAEVNDFVTHIKSTFVNCDQSLRNILIVSPVISRSGQRREICSSIPPGKISRGACPEDSRRARNDNLARKEPQSSPVLELLNLESLNAYSSRPSIS